MAITLEEFVSRLEGKDEQDIECRLDYEDWLAKLEVKPIEAEKGYDKWCEDELKKHLTKLDLLGVGE